MEDFGRSGEISNYENGSYLRGCTGQGQVETNMTKLANPDKPGKQP